MLETLKCGKEARHGFIEEAIRSRLTAQIHAIRQEQGWDLRTFAEKLGKKLSWAYRLEDPNESVPTIPTLLEVAEAFDVGLDVRFRRFSELLEDAANLTPDSFLVPSFEFELKSGVMRHGRRRMRRCIALKRAPKLENVKRSSRRKRIGSSPVRKPPASSYGTGNMNGAYGIETRS